MLVALWPSLARGGDLGANALARCRRRHTLVLIAGAHSKLGAADVMGIVAGGGGILNVGKAAGAARALGVLLVRAATCARTSM